MVRVDGRSRGLVTVAAKCLALVWAGWWTFFVLAAGLSEGESLIEILRHGFWIGPAALVIALLALGCEMLGGILLVLTGVAWSVVYPINFRGGAAQIAFALLTLVAPPLIAGVMLLSRWCKPKEDRR